MIRNLAIAAAAALALTESVVAVVAPRRVASDGDWQAAAAEVRAGFHAGDLIVFAPAWSDQIGRLHLGDLVPVEMAARADADRYSRIWQVSTRGALAPETAGLKAVSTTPHGRVTVALFEKPAVAMLYDFTSHAADAVTVAGKFEPRVLEVDYRPRRGLLVAATPAPTVIEWRDVPAAASLVGYMGLHDYYSRKNGSGPVELAVFVNGQERLRTQYRQELGWARFAVDTHADKAPSTVRVEIKAPDPTARTFGFHMEARQ